MSTDKKQALANTSETIDVLDNVEAEDLSLAPKTSEKRFEIKPPSWVPMLWLAGLLALLYFVSAQPLVKSDSAAGSNLALQSALTLNRTFSIDHFTEYTARNMSPVATYMASPTDYLNLSYFQGHYYSDQAPGLALLTAPMFEFGRFMGVLYEVIDPGSEYNSAVTATYDILACVLLGVATMLLVYAAACKLGSANASARYAAVALGFSSGLWGAATNFKPQILSLALLSLALLLSIPPLPRDLAKPHPMETLELSWGRGLSIGLILGFATVVDYTNIVWTLIFAIYLIAARRISFKPISSLLAPLVGWVVGLLPLIIYNTVIFGKPWAFTYSFNVGDKSGQSVSSHFLSNFDLNDLQNALFTGGRAMLGPFLIFFGIWGLAALFVQRGKRKEAALFLALIVASFVLGLLHHPVGQEGLKAEFMVGVLPPLAIATAVWHERFQFFTRLDQKWVPYLAVVGMAIYYFISPPGPFLPNFGNLLYMAPLIIIAGLVIVAWQLMHNLDKQRKVINLGLATIIILLLFTAAFGPVTPAFAVTNGRYGNNLLYNWQLSYNASSKAYDGWYVSGSTTAAKPSGMNLNGNATLEPYLASAQGGKAYYLSFAVNVQTAATLQVSWIWTDEAHEPTGDFEATYNLNNSQTITDNRAAPAGTNYLQLIFHQTGGQASYTNFALLDNSVRIEPMPNYNVAALAFTFDWESAMGGLIHSQGGSGTFLAPNTDKGESGSLNITNQTEKAAFDYATKRGLRMRQGADNLVNIFNKYGGVGTFYSTGYNLIDGNTNHTNFVGGSDPIYSWANSANGWSDYWRTHGWYSFDPYTTDQDATGAAWYFGDETQKLLEENQDIQSHTFGHIDVHFATPQQFATDMQAWLTAAKQAGDPVIDSFAFPWKASNGPNPTPDYDFLAKNGFTSVTRLYDYQQYVAENGDTGVLKFIDPKQPLQKQLQDQPADDNYYYYLDRVHYNDKVVSPDLLALHDYELRQGQTSAATAENLIDQLIIRRGYGSIWTHPEEVVDPDQVQQWRTVVAYASTQGGNGLWVDSVSNIIKMRLTTQHVRVEEQATSDPKHIILTIINNDTHDLVNATFTVPGTINSVTLLDNSLHPTYNGSQFLVPQVVPGSSVTVEVELK